MQLFEAKLKRTALYETVADELERLILSGKVGDKIIPSEQYLADSFGVSRPVIREALKILKERGFIDSHQGAQSVITVPGAENLMKSVDRIVRGRNISAAQLYEIRSALEVLSATLAAKNAGNEDIEELRALHARFENRGNSVEELSRIDIEFHLRIAKASGNALLQIMLEAIAPLLLPIFETSIGANKEESVGVIFHNDLINAIENGEEENAGELMRTHLMLSIKNYEFTERKK